MNLNQRLLNNRYFLKFSKHEFSVHDDSCKSQNLSEETSRLHKFPANFEIRILPMIFHVNYMSTSSIEVIFNWIKSRLLTQWNDLTHLKHVVKCSFIIAVSLLYRFCQLHHFYDHVQPNRLLTEPIRGYVQKIKHTRSHNTVISNCNETFNNIICFISYESYDIIFSDASGYD